ncbi:hypothetical protein NYZ99_02170 [Maribacter litopenaei]|uniref:Uncharacterized protein n=1 Tax=Maribacter litopenaei TaxID=2976127 RepID=A0ABY5Y8N0_9FLAO|nr:hypothetical protein [Maribacter litopenaei]UWX55388.1 hypothetical protein NYZ99_02170 [Maribacter litopenaei]
MSIREVVEKIKTMADEMRAELGDSLKGIEGTERREPGKVK